MDPLLQLSLWYGALFSAFLGVVIFGSLAWNPEIWLNDYPPDVKAHYGPPRRPQTLVQRRVTSVLFFGSWVAFVAYAVTQFGALTGGVYAFWPVFLGVFVMLETANIVDWLVFDWLIAVTLRPRFMILPGTEGLAGYRSYAFHFRGFLIGTAGMTVISLLVTGITLGLAWFV